MQFYIYRSPKGGGTDYLRNALNFRKGMSAPDSWMAPIEVSWIRQPQVPTLELAFSVTSGIYIDVVERNLTDLGISVVSDKPVAFRDRTLPSDLMTSTSSNSELDTKTLTLTGNSCDVMLMTVESNYPIKGTQSTDMSVSNLDYYAKASNSGAAVVSDGFLYLGNGVVSSSTSNSVYSNDVRYEAAKAVDGDNATTWISNAGWLNAGAYVEFALSGVLAVSGIYHYSSGNARNLATALVEVKVGGVWYSEGIMSFPATTSNIMFSKQYMNPQGLRITPKTNLGDTYVHIAEIKFLGAKA